MITTSLSSMFSLSDNFVDTLKENSVLYLIAIVSNFELTKIL